MNITSFKPQDYCDCTLVEALDSLVRRARVIDDYCNPKRAGLNYKMWLPTQERPWVYLDSWRIKKDYTTGPDDLDIFMANRPVLNKGDKERNSRYLADIKAYASKQQVFMDAVKPLFLALEEGVLVLNGFEKRGKKAAATVTPIDKGRWRMAWTITRADDGDGALLELFSSLADDPEVAFTGCRLTLGDTVKPPQGLSGMAVSTVSAEKAKLKPGRKKIDDSAALSRLVEIIESGSFPSIKKAVDWLCDEGKVQVIGASRDAIYERLRLQLGTSWVIDEGSGIVQLTPVPTRDI